MKSSIVVDHLQTKFPSNHDVVAYVYCSRKYREKQKCVDIISSFLKQIVLKNQEIPEEVREEFCRHGNGRNRRSLTKSVDLLSTLLKRYRRSFLVLDALDEYFEQDDGSETRTTIDILDELQRILSNTESTCRLFLTSRVDRLAQCDTLGATKVCIKAKEEDVKSYIVSRINDSRKFAHANRMKEEPNLQDELIATLVQRANGQ